jgi:hypothetical protein
VLGAGFVLGPIRILLVVPHLGVRMAELIEMPIMLAVIIISARWIVRHLSVPPTITNQLCIGCLALALLLTVELTFVLWLQGLSIGEYLATRDPVSGTVYYLMLGLFAIMPLLVVGKLSQPIKR